MKTKAELISDAANLARTAGGYTANMGNLSVEQVETALFALGIKAAEADPKGFVKLIPDPKPRGRKSTKDAK